MRRVGLLAGLLIAAAGLWWANGRGWWVPQASVESAVERLHPPDHLLQDNPPGQSPDPVLVSRPMPAMKTASTVDPSAHPAPIPQARSTTEARAALDRAQRDTRCDAAHASISERVLANLENVFWSKLPAEVAARERAGRLAAAARTLAHCDSLESGPAAERRRRELRDHALAVAARAGDLQAQLQLWSPRQDPDRTRLRALLYEALLSADPRLIASLAHHERSLWLPGHFEPDTMMGAGSSAWRLVACDLGLDCGPGSSALDQMCMHENSVACGVDSLEEALRISQAPGVHRRVQQRRQELLARIREGRIAGLFGPPARTGGGP